MYTTRKNSISGTPIVTTSKVATNNTTIVTI